MIKSFEFCLVGTIMFGLPLSVSATTYTPTSTRPTCASMGYVSTAEECVGYTKIRCPFNEDAYFCGKSGTTTIRGDNFNCADRSGKLTATYCTELGYNRKAAQCTGYEALPCPFDSNFVFCGVNGCSDDGFTYSTLEACKAACATCSPCPSNSYYNTTNYKGTNCPTQGTCSAGMVLYSNNKCYSSNASVTLADGSKPVGVMISNTLAIDLLETQSGGVAYNTWSSGTNLHGTGSTWSPGNWTALRSLFVSDYSSSFQRNTTTIYTAPDAVACTSSWCSHLNSAGYSGNWFLPSYGDITTWKNNVSAYITGMGRAGKSTSITSADSNIINKTGYRAYYVTENCSCSHLDTSYGTNGCDGSGCAYTWNAGGVYWHAYYDSSNLAATYKRCMRVVNSSSASSCSDTSTVTFSSKYCQGSQCITVSGGSGGDVVIEPIIP